MPLFGKKDGVAKVDSVIGQFQEMQAELAEGQDLIEETAAQKARRVRELQAEIDELDAKADEARAFEAGLRALTQGPGSE